MRKKMIVNLRKIICYVMAFLMIFGSIVFISPENAMVSAADESEEGTPMTMHLPATEDTRVQGDAPTSNYGTAALQVRYSTTGTLRTSYLQFDLNQLRSLGVPATTSVKLKLWISTTPTGSGAFDVYGLPYYDGVRTWNDKGLPDNPTPVTLSNPLNEENKVLVTTRNFTTADLKPNCVELDVTTYINSQLASTNATSVTFMLKGKNSPGNALMSFYASEEATYPERRPDLEINYPAPPPAGKLKKPVPSVDESTPLNIKLTWPVVTGSVSYSVYRSEYEPVEFTVLTGTPNTVGEAVYYNDTTVQPGVRYFYQIKANAIDEASSSVSQALDVTVPELVLQKPGSLSAGTISYNVSAFSWSPVQYAVSYAVFRSENDSGGYTLIGSSSGAGYTDYTVGPDKKYYYKVQAIRDTLSSEISDPLEIITLKPPSAGEAMTRDYIPTDDSFTSDATQTIGGVQETPYTNFGTRDYVRARYHSGAWKRFSYFKFDLGDLVGVTSAQSVKLRLYISNMDGGGNSDVYGLLDNNWNEETIHYWNAPSQAGKVLTPTRLTYTNSPAERNSWVEFDVTDFVNSRLNVFEKELTFMILNAYGQTGSIYFGSKESDNDPTLRVEYLNPGVIPPLEKPVPYIDDMSFEKVTIAWPIVPAASKYKVYRSPKGENNFELAAGNKYVSNGKVYFEDANVVFGKEFQYKVEAIGLNDTVKVSDLIDVNFPHLVLGKPTAPTSTFITGTSVDLAWETVQYATSYSVYRSISANDGYEFVVGNITASTYKDSGLLADTTYYYKIKASRGEYTSEFSDALMVKTEKYVNKITGIVKLETGTNHSGILVKLMRGEELVKSVLTDTSGNFTLSSIDPGEYTIVYFKAKYANGYTRNVVVDSNSDLNIGEQPRLKFGDLTGDGLIDLSDAELVTSGFGTHSAHSSWTSLIDLNSDSKIDQNDVAIVSASY